METLPTGTETVTAPQEQAIMQLNQRDAVYKFVLEALGADYTLSEGQKLKDLVTKDVRKVIRPKLYEGIMSGAIAYKPTKLEAKVRKYCSGLINDALKKDTRFN